MTENEKKTPKKRTVNPIDPTGEQVAYNIRLLRGTMTYKELSEKMSAVGRAMSVLALRRIEACERKVDVDDLMAFAIVFDVSPLTLLLPWYATADLTTHITGFPGEVGSNVAWLWATCQEPLIVPEDPYGDKRVRNNQVISQFRHRACPTIEPRQSGIPNTNHGDGFVQSMFTNFAITLQAQLIQRYMQQHDSDADGAESNNENTEK